MAYFSAPPPIAVDLNTGKWTEASYRWAINLNQTAATSNTATFITQTSESSLPNSQALSDLNVGFVKVNSRGLLTSTTQITSDDLEYSGVGAGVYELATVFIDSKGLIKQAKSNPPAVLLDIFTYSFAGGV